MPRRSSGGRSAPRPRPVSARSPPPQNVNRAPPPAIAQANGGGGSILGGIGSTIAQGMAWGTGSAIAHRGVDAVMGPRTIQYETVVSSEAVSASSSSSPVGDNTMGSCDIQSKAFQDCVNNFGSDINKCQFYMNMLSECRKSSGSMMAS